MSGVLAAGTNTDFVAEETIFWILAVGAVGAALDRAVLHRMAVATVQRFVTRIGAAVADPAVATAPEPARGNFGWLEFSLAPEET